MLEKVVIFFLQIAPPTDTKKKNGPSALYNFGGKKHFSLLCLFHGPSKLTCLFFFRTLLFPAYPLRVSPKKFNFTLKHLEFTHYPQYQFHGKWPKSHCFQTAVVIGHQTVDPEQFGSLVIKKNNFSF